jgi:hypothetical protein
MNSRVISKSKTTKINRELTNSSLMNNNSTISSFYTIVSASCSGTRNLKARIAVSEGAKIKVEAKQHKGT